MVKENIESIARARGPILIASVSNLADVLCWFIIIVVDEQPTRGGFR